MREQVALTPCRTRRRTWHLDGLHYGRTGSALRAPRRKLCRTCRCLVCRNGNLDTP
jgi:hypothetical protein